MKAVAPIVADVALLETRIGHRFASPALLEEALTHPSTSGARRSRSPFGYERLEFLGDRVLNLVVAEWLMERFPDEPEGALSARHRELVRAEALAEVALRLDLGPHIRMAPSEDQSGGRSNPAILADACEALIGALHLDGGFETARSFVRRAWGDATLERHEAPPRDPKQELQEWAQARGLPLPRYDVVGRTGPDHQPRFVVRVQVEGARPADAEGASKREAEKRAAQKLLESLPR